ncbi:MAG: ATP-binding protein [Planctomycetota bacterium]|nr:ATP-binding protein [Planctomycetota bacterium]
MDGKLRGAADPSWTRGACAPVWAIVAEPAWARGAAPARGTTLVQGRAAVPGRAAVMNAGEWVVCGVSLAVAAAAVVSCLRTRRVLGRRMEAAAAQSQRLLGEVERLSAVGGRTEGRLARMEVLRSIATGQAEGMSASALMAQAARDLSALVGGARVCVWEMAEGSTAVLGACSLSPDAGHGAGGLLGVGERRAMGAAVADALRAGVTLDASRAGAGAAEAEAAGWWRARGSASWVEVGISDGVRLRASVTMDRADGGPGPAKAWDEAEIATLESVTHELSRALLAAWVDEERRVAVEKLRRSEECYRALFERSPDPMVLYDAGSGRVLGLNGAAERLLGGSIPETWALPGCGAEASASGAEASRVRRLIRGATGEMVELVETSHPVEFLRPGARLATLHEVSALRRAEEEAARAESRWRELTEAYGRALHHVAEDAPLETIFSTVCGAVERAEPGVICTVALMSEDGTRLRLAHRGSLPEAAAAMTADLPVRDDLGVCPVAAATGRRVVSGDMLADPRCAPFAEMVSRHALRACWSEPVVGADGRAVGTLAMYRGTPGEPGQREVRLVETAAEIVSLAVRHHGAIASLKETRLRYERALRGTGTLIWEYDVKADVVRMTGQLEAAGRDAGIDEWTGSAAAWRTRVHADDLDAVKVRFAACVERGDRYDVEYRVRLRGTGYRWVRSTGVRREEADGRVVIAGTMIDVTDRRRAMDHLARTNADLERFAAMASHELQEPLRTMRTYADLLAGEAGVLGAEGVKRAGFIRDGASRMQTLVADLLAFARAGGGLDRGLVETGPLVEEAVRAVRAHGAEAGDAVVIVEALPRVCGDGALLRLVFENLVGNAVKFVPPGAGAVRVSASRGTEGWEFRVADEGDGIAAEDRERVFEMFTRLRRRNGARGSGLGLAIARRIVESHGGRIWVEPNTPRGAVFAFTLPDHEGSTT